MELNSETREKYEKYTHVEFNEIAITLWAIKTCHFYFYDNFGKCGPILSFFIRR